MSNKENAMAKRQEVSEQQVRERAYALWEEAGSPTGRETEFWSRARDELMRAQEAGEIVQNDLDQAGRESFPASDPVNRM